MIAFKKVAVLVLLLSLPWFLDAQNTLSRFSQKVDFRIPYSKGNDNGDACGNAILREMAKDVLREPWLVKIRFTCELECAIEQDAGRYQLLISVKHPVIDGDTEYRHFPVAGVLVPSRIDMKLRWANRADTSGYTEVTLAGKPMHLADSVVCSIPVAAFDPAVDTLLVREVRLYYDSLALQTFYNRIELIHDYYASISLLDSLQQFTAGIDPGNAKLLPVNYLKVEEICRVVERIDVRDFPGRLLKNNYDPLGLMRKYLQMYKHSRSLLYTFMDEMHKTGTIPWDGDADRLAASFTSRVYSYVRRSYLMDQQQGRIYNDCLEHFFDRSGFPTEENIPANMLAKMFSEAGQDTVARYMSNRIYASYRNTAKQLMDLNRYAEAFSMLENGQRFIAGNPSLKGTAPDVALQSRAADGICNSYIGIAATCIASHKYDMAETYLSKADHYALEHAEYITSDSSYRVVFGRLFFLRNADCDLLLNQKKYAEALDCYQQFEKAYSAHDLALVGSELDAKKAAARIGLSNLSALLTEDALKHKDSDTALFYYQRATALRQESKTHEPVDTRLDSLAPLIARIRFGQIVKEGAIALEKRQYTLAVNRLKEALILSDNFGIGRGREFDSLYRRSTKNFLIVQLSAAQKKIWANQFDSAQFALDKTETAGFDFGLLNDPDFIAATDNFKQKIREQHCRNLGDSVELRMIRADRSIALRNFVNALVYLREAQAFSHSMPECSLAEQPIRDTLAKYGPAAGYQQTIADVRTLVVSGNYTEAVRMLDGSQQAFETGRLSRFGLHKENGYDFIRDRENPYLTEKAIMLSIDKENYHEAIRFLLLAHDQGLAAPSCAVMQEQLGQKSAFHDYQANPGEDALKNVANHVPAGVWFDSFRSSYLLEWKRLVKTGGPVEK